MLCLWMINDWKSVVGIQLLLCRIIALSLLNHYFCSINMSLFMILLKSVSMIMQRRWFMVLLGVGMALSIHAQSKVYVIFTSSKVETKGVWNSEFERNASVRDTIHLFTLFDRADGNYDEGYFYRFIYKNEKSKPNKPYFFLSITDLKQGVEMD